MLQTLLLIFIGGGTGSVARYGLSQLLAKPAVGTGFPWPTLCVNILGAVFIGVLLEILSLRVSLPQPARFMLVTGFLGGFTTFSAFSLESALMLERGSYLSLATYVTISILGTILCVFMGSALIKIFMGRTF